MTKIVVGVDGSETSRGALEWALEEAEHRGLPVLAVHVYNTGPLYFSDGYAYADAGKVADQVRRDAERTIDEMVQKALVGREHLSVTPLAVEAANPARALTRQAADAAMLVVGTRGHGGFAGLLLGSVSHQCMTHPPCPVTVIPPAS